MSMPEPPEQTPPAHLLVPAKPRRSLRAESGQALVEYAFILVMVALVLLVTLQTIGSEANRLFDIVASAWP